MNPIRRVFPIIRPHLPLLSLSLVLLALVSALEALSMTFVKPVFDDVLSISTKVKALDMHFQFLYRWFDLSGPDLYLKIAAGLFVVTVVKSVALYFANYATILSGQRIVRRMRNDLFDHIMRQSMLFFSRKQTGALISRVVNDVDRLQDTFSRTLADFVRQALTLVAFLAIIFYIDPLLSTLSLVVVPVVAWLVNHLGRKMKRYSWHSQEHLAQISNVIQETVTGSRVVQAFGMEQHEVSRFKKVTEGLFRFNLKTGRITSFNPPFMEMVGVALFIPYLIYAHFRINDGLLTTGSFALFLGSMLRLYDPIRRVSRMQLDFNQTAASMDRITEVLNTHEEVAEKPAAPALTPVHTSVEFAGVCFSYTADSGKMLLPVLQDINLQVRRGETLAIVGSSGAGKSTLVNLIPRFFDPTAGAVHIDGTDVRAVSLASLRAQIAIVTQETFLFNDTVRGNIRYGSLDASDARVESAARAALAHDFITALPDGYDTVIGERGARLSGGERQRLAIARALLRDAPLLILDEATSSLDSESEALVQQALGNLMQNRTVFVIAHRLSTIRGATRIIVLDGGRIAEVGSHDELIQNGAIYRKLYEIQFQGMGQSI